MKGIIAAAFAASLGVVGATSAGAMPLAPFGGAQDGLIEHVAQGCGPGFGRDARGVCRPFAREPRGPRFVAPAPRFVAPAPRPVIVRPRVCPPGYFLSPRGVCRLR